MQVNDPKEAVAIAIRSIFDRWTALRLTIEYQFGGSKDPVSGLVDTTITMATSSTKRHEVHDYVELFYSEFNRMNTDIEDGSPEEVANHIVQLRDAAARGNLEPAWRAAEKSGMSNSALSQSVSGAREEQDDHVEEEYAMDTQLEPVSPVVDEDGFTEVRRSRHQR